MPNPNNKVRKGDMWRESKECRERDRNDKITNIRATWIVTLCWQSVEESGQETQHLRGSAWKREPPNAGSVINGHHAQRVTVLGRTREKHRPQWTSATPVTIIINHPRMFQLKTEKNYLEENELEVQEQSIKLQRLIRQVDDCKLSYDIKVNTLSGQEKPMKI